MGYAATYSIAHEVTADKESASSIVDGVASSIVDGPFMSQNQ